VSISANYSAYIRWGSVAVWATCIFVVSAVPGSSIPGHYGNLAHFAEYAILAILLLRALEIRRRSLPAWISSVLLASAYGVSDELHQLFVPLRVSDPVDWMRDTVGAAAGVACYLLVVRLVRRHGPASER
jgi:VanZ family protein